MPYDLLSIGLLKWSGSTYLRFMARSFNDIFTFLWSVLDMQSSQLHDGTCYIAANYFGISTKIVREVCFENLPRHKVLWHIDCYPRGHDYSKVGRCTRYNSLRLKGSGIATLVELFMQRILKALRSSVAKRKEKVKSWGTLCEIPKLSALSKK